MTRPSPEDFSGLVEGFQFDPLETVVLVGFARYYPPLFLVLSLRLLDDDARALRRLLSRAMLVLYKIWTLCQMCDPLS